MHRGRGPERGGTWQGIWQVKLAAKTTVQIVDLHLHRTHCEMHSECQDHGAQACEVRCPVQVTSEQLSVQSITLLIWLILCLVMDHTLRLSSDMPCGMYPAGPVPAISARIWCAQLQPYGVVFSPHLWHKQAKSLLECLCAELGVLPRFAHASSHFYRRYFSHACQQECHFHGLASPMFCCHHDRVHKAELGRLPSSFMTSSWRPHV